MEDQVRWREVDVEQSGVKQQISGIKGKVRFSCTGVE